MDPASNSLLVKVKGGLGDPGTTYTHGMPSTSSWCSHSSMPPHPRSCRGSPQRLSKEPGVHTTVRSGSGSATENRHGAAQGGPSGLLMRSLDTGGPEPSRSLTIHRGEAGLPALAPPTPSFDKLVTPTSQSSPGSGQKEPGGGGHPKLWPPCFVKKGMVLWKG